MLAVKISEIKKLFQQVARRPGMYGIRSYDEACAFICGYDTAAFGSKHEDCLVWSFSLWLSPRSRVARNVSFHGHVLEIGFPGAKRGSLSPEQDQGALQTLFALLDEFLASDLAEGLNRELERSR